MEAEVDPLPSLYVDLNKYQGNGDQEPGSAPTKGGRSVVLQQQWVTLTASMWPEPTASPRGWKVSAERLPVLAAVFCGAALVVCLLCAFLFYRCCVMPRRDKHYCLRKVDATSSGTQVPAVVSPAYPSQAAVFAEQKGCSWGYSNRLVAPVQPSPWYTPRIIGGPQCTQCPGICPVPRSSSNPGSSSQVQPSNSTLRRQRPVSQPIPSNVVNGEIVPKSPLPEISEFSPNSPQYASSSILDEVGAKDEQTSGEPTLKTRSLPAWVRSKPRPLSTEDDINDLYAKVNFSKKRKNRMRNDEAAIIALSKSRSQFLHKDTDSLVDNEAVIVYDERTAL
ncbi:uncharacterized protein LOC108917562 isoform X1 [Anoplophora glabripennis]|uniref:uncharacterized protein LOC108917562 isoform X1 n=1 Tax=Anoplophora glabripennis TaxID=217634 RepID=UPI0008759B2C|nr:uncharacterized protein LOC108917562 isoform X1 [Anoplophora glabripennis]